MLPTENRFVQLASMSRRAFRRLAAMMLRREDPASVPTTMRTAAGSRRAYTVRRDRRDAGVPPHMRRGAAS